MASEPGRHSLPTTILTGFLGSGKTTLLRRALMSPALSDTAVLVNEIGEIAIDHHLVDFVEGSVLELPGGCLCCAVREDLALGLRRLLQRRDDGEIRAFGRVAIETSGLADPAPILYTLSADPVLDARLRLGRVVTVVDAVTGADTLARYVEAARQVAIADALVISKTDLAPVSADLIRQVDAVNSGAERLVAADIGDIGAVLFSAASPHPNPPPRAGEGAKIPGARTTTPSPAGGGGSGWGRPAQPHPESHAVHTHGIDAFAIVLEGPMTRLQFARALGGLARERGNELLRVKGIVQFSDRPGRPAVVQGAQHAIFAPEWLDDWPDDDRRSRLVFIVHGIPREEILAHFAFASPAILGARSYPPQAVAPPALHTA